MYLAPKGAPHVSLGHRPKDPGMFCERALKARLNVGWTDVYRIESRFQRYTWERTVSWGTAPGCE